MVNPITVLTVAVSVSILIMLGINLYFVVKSRKIQKPDESYVVLHNRMDALAQAVNR